MVLHVRIRMEHVRHGRGVPSLPSSVDGNAVPVVQPLVASLPLVLWKLTWGWKASNSCFSSLHRRPWTRCRARAASRTSCQSRESSPALPLSSVSLEIPTTCCLLSHEYLQISPDAHMGKPARILRKL